MASEESRNLNYLLRSVNDMRTKTPDLTKRFRKKRSNKVDEYYTAMHNISNAQSSGSNKSINEPYVTIQKTDLNASHDNFTKVNTYMKSEETGNPGITAPSDQHHAERNSADSRPGVRVRRVSKMLSVEENINNENIEAAKTDQQRVRSVSMSSLNTNPVNVTRLRRKSSTGIVNTKSFQNHSNLKNHAVSENLRISADNLINANSASMCPLPRTRANSVKIVKMKKSLGKVQPVNNDPSLNLLPTDNPIRSSNGVTITKVSRVKTTATTDT
ncbi:unnamed protein product [Rotaria socialis]|uniref:Uncharacterized protein n=1 Tax=Rotaria socialis TaxID=392032 RepID=A0A821QNY3_9BILA|nr:unnamed protein product [Rotaria socialis]CAF3534452.1 unnamed protein product [Rotaria socialis]CAF4178063.1 unnamed protein product [Rotaria socialis]CAF4827270.1 unnamed protein product [Rotaria socialis]